MRRYLDKLWAATTVMFFIGWIAQLVEIRWLRVSLAEQERRISAQVAAQAERRLETLRADVVRELRAAGDTEKAIVGGMREQTAALERATKAMLATCSGREQSS